MLSLDRGINDPGIVARLAADILENELGSPLSMSGWMRLKSKLGRLRQVARSLPILSAAIKLLESALRLLPFVP